MPRKTRSPLEGCCAILRFNEAAARCRGKPAPPALERAGEGAASMRPRPDAAENVRRTVAWARAARDASMRPRPDAAENIRVPE